MNSSPTSSTTNGTELSNPRMSWANVAYRPTQLVTTPNATPPAKASGMERSPPITAAAVAMNMNTLY